LVKRQQNLGKNAIKNEGKSQKTPRRQRDERMTIMIKSVEVVAEGVTRPLQEKTGDSMNDEEIQMLLENVEANKYAEFIESYLVLSESDKQDPDLMMAYADSLYELGRDAEAIDTYLRYVQSHPKRRGVDFALFGAAMAFKNIGLEAEALYLLKLIKLDLTNLSNEILDSKQKIDIQNQGIDILRRFKQRIIDS